jgi:hypothetical protein
MASKTILLVSSSMPVRAEDGCGVKRCCLQWEASPSRAACQFDVEHLDFVVAMSSKRGLSSEQDERGSRPLMTEGVRGDSDVESDDDDGIKFEGQFEDEFDSEDEAPAPAGSTSVLSVPPAGAAGAAARSSSEAAASASSAEDLALDDDADEESGASKPVKVSNEAYGL